jgi:hypothetical protein
MNNKYSNLRTETGFGGHFVDLRAFGVARQGTLGAPVDAESPDSAPDACAAASATAPSKNASLT